MGFGRGLTAEYDEKDWPYLAEYETSDRQRAKGEMPEYPANQRRYDRFRIVGDRLYTGKRTKAVGDGKTAEKRPKEVFPDIYHQKKIEGEAGPEVLAAGNGPIERELGGGNRWRPSLTDPDGDDLTAAGEGACPGGVRVEHNELLLDTARPGTTEVKLTVRDTGGGDKLLENIEVQSIHILFNFQRDRDV